MNNSAVSFHQMPVRQAGWNRYASITFVAFLHGVVIWALANGLMVKLGIAPPTTFTTPLIYKAPARPTPLPPPPTPTMIKAVPQDVPVPLIPIAQDSNATPIHVTATPQQTHPQTVTAVPDVAAIGVMATHTTPPYPAIARRLGRQGTVILSLSVGIDGAVSNVQIATSSGVAELDQAAIGWVEEHWRYKPAVKAGIPVASTVQAAIKFDLKDAQ